MLKRGAVVLALAFLGLCGVRSEAANQILLSGNVLRKCTLDVTADTGALNLPLTAAGTQRILVGAALQDCNGKRGYTLEVLSNNCLTDTPGAKLIEATSNETVRYTVEASNPTTGGSAPVVTNLLANQCAGQIARDVTSAHIRNETSTFYVSFSTPAFPSAGTYQDVLTFTLTLK